MGGLCVKIILPAGSRSRSPLQEERQGRTGLPEKFPRFSQYNLGTSLLETKRDGTTNPALQLPRAKEPLRDSMSQEHAAVPLLGTSEDGGLDEIRVPGRHGLQLPPGMSESGGKGFK